MDIRRITPNFAVSPQIGEIDADEIARQGFKTVINNRPDREAPGQPDSLPINTAVSSCGVSYLHIPISGGHFTDQNVAEFEEAIRSSSGPVLAFCRSGTRSARLWALAQVGKRSVDEIIGLAHDAGYGLEDMRAILLWREQRTPKSDGDHGGR